MLVGGGSTRGFAAAERPIAPAPLPSPISPPPPHAARWRCRGRHGAGGAGARGRGGRPGARTARPHAPTAQWPLLPPPRPRRAPSRDLTHSRAPTAGRRACTRPPSRGEARQRPPACHIAGAPPLPAAPGRGAAGCVPRGTAEDVAGARVRRAKGGRGRAAGARRGKRRRPPGEMDGGAREGASTPGAARRPPVSPAIPRDAHSMATGGRVNKRPARTARGKGEERE